MKKFALITGCSSGLGLEICNYLLELEDISGENEYTIFGVSRSGSPISHDSYIDFQVDIKDEDQVSEMFDEIGDKCEGINLVINCAGVFELCSLEDMESKRFKNHYETNVLGPFHIFKYVRDFIIEDLTHFITISSIASEKGFANCSAYSSSKFALNGLIDSLEEEWKQFGVKFSTLLPGAIDTPLWDDIEDFDRDKMLSIEEFLHVINMVITAPRNLAFKKLTFLHKSGFLD